MNRDIWHEIKDIKVKRGPDINSDHYLLVMTLKPEEKKESKDRIMITNKKTKCHKLNYSQARENVEKVLNEHLEKTKNHKNTEDM